MPSTTSPSSPLPPPSPTPTASSSRGHSTLLLGNTSPTSTNGIDKESEVAPPKEDSQAQTTLADAAFGGRGIKGDTIDLTGDDDDDDDERTIMDVSDFGTGPPSSAQELAVDPTSAPSPYFFPANVKSWKQQLNYLTKWLKDGLEIDGAITQGPDCSFLIECSTYQTARDIAHYFNITKRNGVQLVCSSDTRQMDSWIRLLRPEEEDYDAEHYPGVWSGKSAEPTETVFRKEWPEAARIRGKLLLEEEAEILRGVVRELDPPSRPVQHYKDMIQGAILFVTNCLDDFLSPEEKERKDTIGKVAKVEVLDLTIDSDMSLDATDSPNSLNLSTPTRPVRSIASSPRQWKPYDRRPKIALHIPKNRYRQSFASPPHTHTPELSVGQHAQPWIDDTERKEKLVQEAKDKGDYLEAWRRMQETEDDRDRREEEEEEEMERKRRARNQGVGRTSRSTGQVSSRGPPAAPSAVATTTPYQENSSPSSSNRRAPKRTFPSAPTSPSSKKVKSTFTSSSLSRVVPRSSLSPALIQQNSQPQPSASGSGYGNGSNARSLFEIIRDN